MTKTRTSRGESHRTAIREAAARNGFELKEYSGYWVLNREGRAIWSIYWLKSGYFGSAYSAVLGVQVKPDYRTHAYTSTSREILDSFIESLDSNKFADRGKR